MAGWRSRASRRNSRLRSQDRTNVAAWQHGDCRRQCIARATLAHRMDAKRTLCRTIRCDRGSAGRGHRRRYGGCATCFSPSSPRPLRPRFGEPDAVIATFVLWRVMAWIGAQMCGKWAVKGERSGGWRDKGTAGCGGCEVQKSLASRAIHILSLLAPLRIFLAILPFLQPSRVRVALHR